MLVETENTRIKVALAIPIGASITVANNVIEMLPLVADRTIKVHQNNQKKQYIY